jgi:crotonobetainyl-CoA:carnitine CoA-transferase CaiB-like acyl-CoA transferase
MQGALADLRVVAVEQFGAGPWGTMQLADLGAEVIKIEDPTVGGDVGRYVPPFTEGTSSLFFESFNRNKRSLTLDLRHPKGRAVFEDVVRRSDAVFSNLRGDQPAKLRLRYDDLSHVNPQIVCASLSGFGMTGPRSGEGAYDITIQALTGWMAVTGSEDAPPTKSGLSLVDFSSGYVAAIALLAAVWQARRDGLGQDLDLSLFDTGLALLTYMGAWTASCGWDARRMPDSAHQTIVPFQAFEAADGWLVIACAKEAMWRRFCVAIERPELGVDERFATFAARDQNRDELLEILRDTLHEHSVEDWIATLATANVPAAPVNSVAGALADDQTASREMVVGYDHPVLGDVQLTASPFTDSGPPRRAPLLGEDTAAVLAEVCGYTDARITSLFDSGALGAREASCETDGSG